MFQAPDYSILDHLSERCAVVDFDFRYVYVNKAAARHEHMSREQMLGHKVPEMRSKGAFDAIFPYLKRCLDQRTPVEFEDQFSHWKIKIEPIPQGSVHSVGRVSHAENEGQDKER